MNLPRSVRFSLGFILGFLFLSTCIRAVFHLSFSTEAADISNTVLLKAYLLGARYDLRLGLVLLVPVLFASMFAKLSPFANAPKRRWIWQSYFYLLACLWVLIQILDFSHYSYLGTKFAASVLNFLSDPKESAIMVWQSYPVLKLIALWGIGTIVLGGLCGYLLRKINTARPWVVGTRKKIFTGLGVFALVVLGIHGKFSQYPLRWSDAYFHPSSLVSALALNPVLNFYDTRKYVGSGYSLERVKAAYPRMAEFLGVNEGNRKDLDYSRTSLPKNDATLTSPNIVIVLMESFSGYKSSLTGNPLNPTPFLKDLGAQSVVFDRFFTPHSGTARGVFATLTGLPDVDLRNTSSRNPAAVEQHSLIRALKEYEAHYFIGGSTSWANVRGVIQKNIPNVTIHEEGSFKAPVVDVWGISDKSLFLDANEVFKGINRPFFSVIQTAGNHRPYTIPKEDTDFQVLSPSPDQLRANGFASVEEFNAFRYMDYAVKSFIETAKKETYYQNTIFVFLGDHGIAAAGHDVGPHMGRAYLDLKLSAVHTPLIIHAPKYLQPARYSKIGSQIDVLPTVLAIAGKKYKMTALGRDLLDPSFDDRRYAFTIYHDGVGEIGLLDDRWYYIKKAGSSKGKLHAWTSLKPAEDVAEENSEIAGRFNQMLDDYYQTAQYMLTNNRQQSHTAEP